MQYEEKLQHPCRGLTGNELIESSGYDEIIMIRTIEDKKEELRKDPALLFPIINRKTLEYVYKEYLKHIYKEYCPTQLNLDNIRTHIFRDAINLLFLEE